MSETNRSFVPSALSWLQDAIGDRLLKYLLDCTSRSLEEMLSGDLSPSEKRIEIINILSGMKQQLPENLDEAAKNEALRNWLTQVDSNGKPVVGVLRQHVSGAEPVPESQDSLEAVMGVLAVECYPAFLFPLDSFGGQMPILQEVSRQVYSLILRHPQAEEFSNLILSDPTFRDAFAAEEKHSGRVAMVYRNTGRAGGVQLSMLPATILIAAWRHTQDAPSPQAFATEAMEQLRLVRNVFAGRQGIVSAKLAFAGVLLPSNANLNFGEATVRPVNESDRKIVPESLKGKLGGTDSSGNSTTINYDGDVLLECSFFYKVRVEKRQQNIELPFPEDMRPPPVLEQVSTRLRFSLMLATKRVPRAQLVPTWRYFDEPLGQGTDISWSDPRMGSPIMPTQLTEAEAQSWGEWYQRLDAQHVDTIELALSRILRAVAERREPSDVLIDSVIAWENLFGTKEGEPTFRVTMCLASLLKESLQERKEFKTRLGKIYALRSKVVHGSGKPKEGEYPLCYEALDVAIDAVRLLTSDRVDILKLRDGAARSATLLLEN
ncbi:hypothetical protein ACH35V_13265 [Actinomadura sp. 1N219]|uniref:hypothetical protein n=1 Tax=Actinomadura sp. 1N219 TaxID=3375152 RepID=UPI0037AA7F46